MKMETPLLSIVYSQFAGDITEFIENKWREYSAYFVVFEVNVPYVKCDNCKIKSISR